MTIQDKPESGTQGFTLVEALVVIAVAAAGLLAIVKVFDLLSINLRGSATAATREAIVSNIKLATGPKGLVLRTAPANPANLNVCVQKQTNPDCVGNTPMPIALLDVVDGIPITGAGTPASGATPVRYDLKGQICPGPASASCPFEAYSEITPICPLRGASCQQAEVLQVHFIVRISPALPPQDYTLAPVDQVILRNVADLMGASVTSSPVPAPGGPSAAPSPGPSGGGGLPPPPPPPPPVPGPAVY